MATRRPAADASQSRAPALVQLYFELIEFLDILVDVDVQSGTSAGGINSVLLSYCRANDKDMGGLRDIWLDLGALEDLLRKPTDQSLPSLMYGDGKMLAGLHAALDQLERSDANLPSPSMSPSAEWPCRRTRARARPCT